MNHSSDRRNHVGDKSSSWPIWTPLIAMLVVSALVRLFDLDRQISSCFYDRESHYWPCERSEPWLSFYRYGIHPPLLLGIGGAVVFVLGNLLKRSIEPGRLQRWRRGGLFLALMILIGPGLLINGGFKSLGGRPRPLQCQEFDGSQTFRQVGEFTTQEFPNSSFPSGHASIAFFLMGPAFLFAPRTRERRLWMVVGVSYGLAMGITRVLQGGHFATDILWAGLFVYLVGAILARILLREEAIEIIEPTCVAARCRVAA